MFIEDLKNTVLGVVGNTKMLKYYVILGKSLDQQSRSTSAAY